MTCGDVDKSEILRPDLSEQFSLELSARAEYVMPFFTLSVRMGTNFIGKVAVLSGTHVEDCRLPVSLFARGV